MIQFFKLKTKEGFTMIELLVAVGLFVVVVALASGIFIQSLRTQRAVVNFMAANDNASVTIERMAREIRIGFQFSTNSLRDELSFISQREGSVTYSFNSDTNAIERNGVAITGDDIKVEYLLFDLLGDEIGDGASTRITIRVGVSAVDKQLGDTTVNLQTTVSSRQLDT